MNSEWFTLTLYDACHVFVSCLCVYAALVALVRFNGLRTFSKMSSFDFPVTVAIGSIVATTVVSKDPAVLQGGMAIVSLLFLQWLTSSLRRLSGKVEGVVDNCPLMLMDGPEILHHNLTEGRVTVSDLRAKLREANVMNYNQVRAVVLEATGDISVLHCADPDTKFDSELLEGIRS